MTFRAVEILKTVDLILAEDTRHTRKLLSYFDIHTPLTSYHEHNKKEKTPSLIKMLLDGKNLACVSDAGLPCIADPGEFLVKSACEKNIPIVPIPGANAALSALIASGLSCQRFCFLGFLPKTKKKRLELLHEIENYPETLIIYEAPHHLKKTIEDVLSVLNNRKIALAHELTKKFERFFYGTLETLRDELEKNDELLGEYVLVIEGKEKNSEPEKNSADDDEIDLEKLFEKLLQEGFEKKEAMKEMAKRLNLSRREIYQRLLKK